MSLIDGRVLAADLRAATTLHATELTARGVVPGLAIVVPTGDEATAWYVRSLVGAARKVGVRCDVIDVPAPSGAAGVAAITAALRAACADPAVHGVVCQTPLPAGVALADVATAISPGHDVDGANPASLGGLMVSTAAATSFAPATAAAILALLRHAGVALAGRHAVVVGRSTVVGKPAAALLLAQDATVTVCHSRTADLAAHTRTADVLVVAAGRPGLIGAAHVKDGAVVIDAGTTQGPDGRLVGDVDTDAVARRAAVTPVPGGVGPVTTAVLLDHVVRAAARMDREAVGDPATP